MEINLLSHMKRCYVKNGFKICKYFYGPGNREINNSIKYINNFTFLNESY